MDATTAARMGTDSAGDGEDINDKDISTVKGDAASMSYLPAWYLEMKRSLESSKANHAALEIDLGKLKSNTNSLSHKMTDARRENAESEAASIESAHARHNGSPKRPRGSLLTRVPADVLGYMFLYLDVAHIVRLEAISKEMQQLCHQNKFWKLDFRTRCPHLRSVPETVSACREEIVEHARATYDCCAFVKTMKEQRSVSKHSSIDPRRFSRSEKSVSHPLPLFDHSLSMNRSVMSQSDTFSTDMHSMALQVLGTMYRITSHEKDPIHFLLHRDGVVTVLVSLLANEAGHIHDLSCTILANLLVWEGRRCHAGIASTPVPSVISNNPVAKQIMACDGRNKLHALLTSPSASVNLAGPGERTMTLTG